MEETELKLWQVGNQSYVKGNYEQLFSWSRNETFHWEDGSRFTNASEERIKKNSASRLRSKVTRGQPRSKRGNVNSERDWRLSVLSIEPKKSAKVRLKVKWNNNFQ